MKSRWVQAWFFSQPTLFHYCIIIFLADKVFKRGEDKGTRFWYAKELHVMPFSKLQLLFINPTWDHN